MRIWLHIDVLTCGVSLCLHRVKQLVESRLHTGNVIENLIIQKSKETKNINNVTLTAPAEAIRSFGGTDEMFTEYPDIVTVDHLMQMLHIGKSSAYALLKSNQIRHVRVGKKYIIPKGAVIGFINSMCYDDTRIIDGGLQLVTEGNNVL